MATPPRSSSNSSMDAISVGGFSVELVGPSDDSKCPVCLFILRDPHLTSCGHHFCQNCIERVFNSSQPCPVCRETRFTIFANLEKKREVLLKEAYCINKPYGCPWKGSLGSLFEDHLNKGECSYAKVPCRYNCGQYFRPQDLVIHQSQCPKMPLDHVIHVLREEQAHIVGVVTSLMKQVSSLKEDNKHLKENNRLLKKELDEMKEKHYSDVTDLLETQKETQLQLATGRGKSDQLGREVDRLFHKVNDSQLTLQIVQENRAGIVGIMPFMDKISGLPDRITQLELTSKSAPPIMFILGNFNGYLQGGWWQSDPFYSHPGGYKFRLEVKPAGTGNGAGTHVSVYVHVMRGEYDELLRWPLSAFVHFRLLDNLDGQNHFENKVFFARDNEASQRITDPNKLTGTGRGYAQFIPVTQLDTVNSKFLDNDTLAFEITKVVFK